MEQLPERQLGRELVRRGVPRAGQREDVQAELGPAWFQQRTWGHGKGDKYVDVRTVAIHELGHQVYLSHPSSCGSMTTNEILAAMNPNWFQKWYTNTDDIAGLQYRK